MDLNNSGFPALCYADSVVEFPDILLSVPPESLSRCPCSQTCHCSRKVNTAMNVEKGNL